MVLYKDREKVVSFLHNELRLLDEHNYEEWEKLWDDNNTFYWIPAGAEDSDPEWDVQFVYDNRQRLSTRLKKYLTGLHYSQAPQSRTMHMISNIEITDCIEDIYFIEGNLLVLECRDEEMNFWPAKVTYKLKEVAEDYRIVEKKVTLINSDQPIKTLGFIL